MEEICHDEQMTIWSGEVVGALGLGGYLRDDLSYDDGIDLNRFVADEIRLIVASALDHPQAYTSLLSRLSSQTKALEEAEARNQAANRRIGDLKAIHSRWSMQPRYERDDEKTVIDMEQIAYSVHCYLTGVDGPYLTEARAALATKEKSDDI